jgi:DNA-binding NarL/FixJ family response regulator
MIRLLLVDDHPIVLDGLAMVLGDQPDLEVVASAGCVADAVKAAREHRPDVVLLDLELPDGSGAEAMPQMLEAAPASRVVVFTAYSSDENILGSLRAGAKGYLLKGASTIEIVTAIRTVHAGGSHLEAGAAARVLASLHDAPDDSPTLTAREEGVLHLLADGLPNKQIARALGITERTVKFHVASIFRKLDADSRTQAVSIALRRGLLGTTQDSAPSAR